MGIQLNTDADPGRDGNGNWGESVKGNAEERDGAGRGTVSWRGGVGTEWGRTTWNGYEKARDGVRRERAMGTQGWDGEGRDGNGDGKGTRVGTGTGNEKGRGGEGTGASGKLEGRAGKGKGGKRTETWE